MYNAPRRSLGDAIFAQGIFAGIEFDWLAGQGEQTLTLPLLPADDRTAPPQVPLLMDAMPALSLWGVSKRWVKHKKNRKQFLKMQNESRRQTSPLQCSTSMAAPAAHPSNLALQHQMWR